MVAESTIRSSVLKQRSFDVVVVGTGMGGSTLGYMLAKAGKRVLFCEQGSPTHLNGFKGHFADTLINKQDPADLKAAKLLISGRNVQPIFDTSKSKTPSKFTPFLGAGSGGSTALYGGILQRFSPEDFSAEARHLGSHDSALPASWPISYEDLQTYYLAAEKLYGIGRETASFSSLHLEWIAEHLRKNGLEPYRLPIANLALENCQGCQGFLCARNCKIDSAKACLMPALSKYGATLINNCRVSRILADGRRANAIEALVDGEKITIKAEIFVLAAGAIETPRILMQSSSRFWPNGLGNRSDQVGRNLMRHYIDLYAIKVPQTSDTSNLKELGCRIPGSPSDSFCMGTIQSFGSMPPAAAVLEEWREAAEVRTLASFGLTIMTPFVEPIFQKFFGQRTILATIMEDLPYSDNRVYLDPKGATHAPMRLEYRIHDSERRRIKSFRKRVKAVLNGLSYFPLLSAEDNRRIAHVCGTCRFGNDGNSSVLNADNRSHDVENLYVVDASFFPSSACVNPGLTIAANAIRVAEIINKGNR